MAVKYFSEPSLDHPVMIASWPGIGNIGMLAVENMRQTMGAEPFAEIEPWDFFYPRRVIVKGSVLDDMEFPSSKFYYKRSGIHDLIFFVGEEQPTELGREYAEGRKAYTMANLVLDVARKFQCRRIYTSGAAVAPVHHTARPRVWAVPNSERLLSEIRRYPNTVLMSDIQERGSGGSITGLNGLLLGIARRAGMDAICLMGEIPIYLQGLSIAYPRATMSVLEVLADILDTRIEMEPISRLVGETERDIEAVYQAFPAEIREQLDKLVQLSSPPAQPGPITEEDKKQILEDIDKFFKKKED